MARSHPPLILASQSPRRRLLLKGLRVPFKVIPSDVSETSNEKNPRKLAELLALRKAQAVAERVGSGIVLGADTVVVLGKEILGKPADSGAAYRMLYKLSGTTHHVITGVAFVDAASGRQWVGSETSRVRMKKLEIETLLKLSHRHLDKAGGYAIQEKKDPIAQVISGSYENVVGLPIELVKKQWKAFVRSGA